MTREQARQQLRNAGFSHRMIASVEHFVESIITERHPVDAGPGSAEAAGQSATPPGNEQQEASEHEQ